MKKLQIRLFMNDTSELGINPLAQAETPKELDQLFESVSSKFTEDLDHGFHTNENKGDIFTTHSSSYLKDPTTNGIFTVHQIDRVLGNGPKQETIKTREIIQQWQEGDQTNVRIFSATD